MESGHDLTVDEFLKNLQQFREAAVLLCQNHDGTYATVFVTEQFAHLVELPIEEAEKWVAELGYLQGTHAEDRIFVRRMLRRHVNEEGGSNLIIRILTTKGHEIYCDVHYSFFNLGEKLYIYCTYVDITLLKTYEQRLFNAYTNLNDNFYKISDSTLGLFRVNLSKDIIEDMQGRELFSTDSLISPYSAVLVKRSTNCIIPHERDQFLETFDPEELIVAYLKGRSQVSQVYYSRRPDGSSRYVTMSANTTRHPMTGDFIAFLAEEAANQTKVKGTLLDRILVRQFDMVAWISEDKYGVVIGDASLIGRGSIFPKNRTGNYADYLSSQVKPVLYGSEAEANEMFKALELETIAAKLSQANPYVVNIIISIDSDIWYKRFAFYQIDPEANFYIALKSDTTDLQREQIRNNTQLKLALEEAQQANVAKTAFLSRMSHEIRTPMNAIIGLGTLAQHDPNLAPSIKEYLTKIDISAKNLLSIINDILDMSRIESGHMDIKNDRFSFKNFLDALNSEADAKCAEKGLEYECLIDGVLANYYIGDDTKLRQVLSNVLDNAIKFTAKGGRISLKVDAKANLQEQVLLRFIVEDTGIGIDSNYLPKIFEPFSQEDSSNTSQYTGSGLGLAICKNILGLMNGDIEIQSTKNKGSTFTITVPLKEAVDQGGSAIDLDLQNLRVLIVDDDPVALRHAQLLLSEYEIIADTSLSGEEALTQVATSEKEKEPYNLILIDLRMPEKDGIQVAREIRKVVGSDPTIIITAYSWIDLGDEAKAAGVDSFIAKPIFAHTVLQEYKRIWQRKQPKIEPMQKADLQDRRVLLVEDIPLNAEIMIQLLGILGMKVEHAENGQIAVDMFKNSEVGYYDAILMDLRMPVLDGWGATKIIRELDKADAKLIPIISLTANAFDEDIQLSMQAGMNDHLTKPVDPDNLAETLAYFIGKYDAERKV